MMRKYKEFSVLILTFIIVIPLFIGCSSSRTAATRDQGTYIEDIVTSRSETGTSIEIMGNSLGQFNAFQLHDKNKLIIDLPDAKFVDIPELGEVNVGCVNRIKILQFADEERRLARIEIDLSQEVFPEFSEDSKRIGINLMHREIERSGVSSISLASLVPTNVISSPDTSSDTGIIEESEYKDPVEEISISEAEPEDINYTNAEEAENLQDSEPEETGIIQPILPEEETGVQEEKEQAKDEEEFLPEEEEMPLAGEEVSEILSTLEGEEREIIEEPEQEVVEEEKASKGLIPDVPVSWYLRDAGLREFLRLVAKEYNFNLVIDPEVAAKITVHLDKVPLPSALTTVLNSYGFSIEIREGIVRVGTLERLSQEREREAIMKQNMKLTVELKKESRSLNYASAKDLKKIVEKLLTKNRSDAFAATDERTNTLLVYDTPDNLNVIWDWVEKLDRQTKQVYIQARIVQTSKKFARSLGIQWGGTYVADAAHGNSTGYRFPSSVSLAGAAGAMIAGGSGAALLPAAVNLPTSDINSGIGILLGDTLDTVKLDIALSASENEEETKILSTPRVTTSDNVQGSIKFGQEYPFQTRDENGAIVTSFKETVTSINVTPHTTYDNYIKMKIMVTKDSFAGFTPQGIVFLNKNEAKMEVLVKDGDTAVIGGLNTSNISNTHDQVPVLNKIPILGWLFKKQVKQNEKDDMLIFLTPHIVR